MSRIPIAAGNWKMNKTAQEASAYAEAFLPHTKNLEKEIEIIICPPFTALSTLSPYFRNSLIKLGAQNMHWEEKGAFTGEVCAPMIKEWGCQYVILGHSERRHIFRETSEEIGKKVKKALEWGINPILCVGETIEEREKGETEKIVEEQLLLGVADIPDTKASSLVVAYEPVWAIGTGKAATPEDAREIISFIRDKLSFGFSSEVSDNIRILYGGSVSPENVLDFLRKEEIDGTLVGGASLDPLKMIKIVEETLRAY